MIRHRGDDHFAPLKRKNIHETAATAEMFFETTGRVAHYLIDLSFVDLKVGNSANPTGQQGS